MSDRTAAIYCARVYLAQSRHFTGWHRGFSFRLLEWAGQCRRRAAAACLAPTQGELFGGAA